MSSAEFVVEKDDAGSRLDRFLTKRRDDWGRKLSARLCEEGLVRVDGRRCKKSHLLAEGSVVVVEEHSLGAAAPAPEIPVELRFENESLLVVEKPPGVPSGAVLGKETGTMAGALLARYPELKGVGYGPAEPGLVHRLDTETSGLLMAARNSAAFSALQKALTAGHLKKRYLALVAAGSLADSGSRVSPIGPDPRGSRRVVELEEGVPRETKYEVLQRGPTCDLVQLEVSTAYRHQIRCHLGALGAPLLSDTLYNGPESSLGQRHALHASYIAGEVEGVGSFEATSPLPADLAGLLEER